MPANLNALIRYKTINACLYGGKRRWSIEELRDKCSDALAEYRGKYDTVSERTIRDDIRVMRSDILGYNAPIVQKQGMYYYSDNSYSIMTLSLTDSVLIKRIIMFLGEIKTKVSHPELEIILDKLTNLKSTYQLKEEAGKEVQSYIESGNFILREETEASSSLVKKHSKVKATDKRAYISDAPSLPMPSAPYSADFPDQITWGNVLNTLFVKQ
jgi:hypothetical protein